MASTQTMLLADLHSHDIFCTPIEARFDRITRLAQVSLGVPVVAITVRSAAKLWFKSVIGWNIRELPLADSLSELALLSPGVVIIDDTRLDPTLRDHPLVARRPHFRFYAGQRLTDHRGIPVGTLDIYDSQPREMSARDLVTLQDIAYLARKELFTSDLRDVQVQLVKKLDSARRQSLMDPLTRTWNRRAADGILQRAVENADRDGTPLALCAVDVDKFKQINDTFGHPVGDLVLRRVARALISVVRDGDAVCRMGGDEFLIVMERADPDACAEIPLRAAQALKGMPVRTENGEIPVSISIGIALREPGTGTLPGALVSDADRHLYVAKQGRAAAIAR